MKEMYSQFKYRGNRGKYPGGQFVQEIWIMKRKLSKSNQFLQETMKVHDELPINGEIFEKKTNAQKS